MEEKSVHIIITGVRYQSGKINLILFIVSNIILNLIQKINICLSRKTMPLFDNWDLLWKKKIEHRIFQNTNIS